MDIKEIITFNLRRLRKVRKLTQEELAAKYGCNASYLSQLETGKVTLGTEPAAKLANIYGVDQTEFIRLPPKIGDEALNEIWQNVYEIKKGDQAVVFKGLIRLFQRVNSGEVSSKAIEGLRKYIETFLES